MLRACLAPPRPCPCPSPPPRGPRPRRTAGPVTLAQPPPRSILRSRPQLASSSFPQRPAAQARPGHARLRGDPTGSAGARAQRRSGFGDAGAASAPFPEVSAPLPGELSPPPGPEGRLCVSGARGRLSGHGRARISSGTRASAQPSALAPAGVSAASGPEVAGPSRAEPLRRRRRGCAGARDWRIRSGSAERAARRRPTGPAKPRFRRAGGLAEVGFLRKSCSRSPVHGSLLEPQRLVAPSVAKTFLIMWAETRQSRFLFCFVFSVTT